MKTFTTLQITSLCLLFSFGCASLNPTAQKPGSNSRSISSVDGASTRPERQRAAAEELISNNYLSRGYEKINEEVQLAPTRERTYGAYVLKKDRKYVYVVVRVGDINFESGDAVAVTSGVMAVTSVNFSTPELDSKFKPKSLRPLAIRFFPRTDSDSEDLRQKYEVTFALESDEAHISRSLKITSSDVARSGDQLSLSTEYENRIESVPRVDRVSCFVKPGNDNSTYKLISHGAVARVDDLTGQEETPLNDWDPGDFNSLYGECLTEAEEY